MASQIERQASRDKALAESAIAIAVRQSDGTAGLLTGVQHFAHVGTLQRALDAAKWAASRISKEPWESARDREPNLADIRHAAYPWPTIPADRLMLIANQVANEPGCKLAANRLTKRAEAAIRQRTATEGNPRVIFTDADALSDLRTAFAVTGRSDQELLVDYDRLQAMGITDNVLLRSALRTYLGVRTAPVGPDPVLERERALIGREVGVDFFPTPPAVIDELLSHADVRPGMTVLEPSAGKGDIAAAIRERAPDATVVAVELSAELADIIEMKQVANQVHRGDFLTWQPAHTSYDRIVANVPFSDEVRHVRRAAELLAPGGRLTTVMSSSPFHGQDHDSVAFRAWVDAQQGVVVELPSGSFAGRDAFRTTGVETRILVIDRPRQ